MKDNPGQARQRQRRSKVVNGGLCGTDPHCPRTARGVIVRPQSDVAAEGNPPITNGSGRGVIRAAASERQRQGESRRPPNKQIMGSALPNSCQRTENAATHLFEGVKSGKTRNDRQRADAGFLRLRSGSLQRDRPEVGPRLYGYFRQRGLPHEAAEDLTQETLARIDATKPNEAGRYDPDRPFPPWVYRIARNSSEDRRKREARQPHPTSRSVRSRSMPWRSCASAWKTRVMVSNSRPAPSRWQR
jgi:hypothetical protein